MPSFPRVGKKTKWPSELMTTLIPPNGDPGRVDIKICTVAMSLSLKNTGSRGQYDLSAQETMG